MGEASIQIAEGSDSLERQRAEDRDKPSRGRDRVLGDQRDDTSDVVMSTRRSPCYY
jgi:hypothetical protein